MKGWRQPSDVSGDSVANLRKVHCVREDFRLKVGVKSKTTHSNTICSKNHLSWYVAFNSNPLEEKLSRMPQIQWKCPPKLGLDPGWRVASGEESCEVDTQKYRETTVIEAVYPHLSAIPPSPLISPDMEGKHDDDNQIPLISAVPIEEAAAIEMPLETSTPVKTFNCHSTSESLALSQCNTSVSPNPPISEKSLLNVLHGLEGRDLEVAAGAAATVAAVMESKHEIDTELLIKFLTDPEMMKTLINETGIGANTEPRFPSGPIPITNPLFSNSAPDGIFMTVSIPMNESAAKQGASPAKRARICSPNLVKNWSPAPLRSNSHPPRMQDLTNEASKPAISRSRTHGANKPRPLTPPTLNSNENQYVRLLNQYGVHDAVAILPLYPSFSKLNTEAAIKPMVKQHQPPFVPGMKSVFSPSPFSSTSTPYMHSIANGYRAPDHSGLKPSLGSNPFMPSALESNFTSTACAFPSMNPVDTNYCKSLIKQHGEKHIRNEDKLPKYGEPLDHLRELELAQNTKAIQINHTFQKPCMFFNSSKGCRKGSNCPYMHVMSTWRVEEAPLAKKMSLGNRSFESSF